MTTSSNRIYLVIFNGIETVADQTIQQWEQQLTNSEQRRAQTINSPKRYRQFIIGRKLLTDGMQHFLDLKPNITISKNGKPLLNQGACSITHSNNIVSVAFTKTDLAIGLDLETNKQRDYLASAENFFHPREYQQLKSLNDDAQKDYFYQLWTQKEAYSKATDSDLMPILRKNIEYLLPRDRYQHHTQRTEEYTLSLITESPTAESIEKHDLITKNAHLLAGVFQW